MPLSRFRVVVSRVSRRRVDARARGIRKPAEAGLIPCWTLFRLSLFGHKPIELAYDVKK